MQKKSIQKLLLSLLFSCVLTGLVALTTGSTPVSAAARSYKGGGQNPLTGIRMLDRSNGWALTDTQVLRTSDGGVHWKDVGPTVPGSKASFLNANDAWVVSSDRNKGKVTIRRTTDGGAQWQTSTFSTGEDALLPDMPHFLNETDGWLMVTLINGVHSTKDAIYKTTDGGRNWSRITDQQQIDQGRNFIGLSSGISIQDQQNIWYTEMPTDTMKGEGMHDQAVTEVSHDGGKTWHSQFLPTIQGFKNAFYKTTPPVFIGQKVLMPVYIYMSSDTSTNVYMDIYASDNGGKDWHTTTLLNIDANMVNASDAQHISVDTKDGYVYTTNDGGNHWHQITPTGVIGDLDFVDGNNGFFITATTNKYLLRTSDGGKTWNVIDYSIQ